MTRKPAFYAYATSSKLIGKATPKIEEDKESGLCKAYWKSPEGKSVIAVWSYKKPLKTTIDLGGKFKILDIYGKEITGSALENIYKKNSDSSFELLASDYVVYIVSDK